MKHDHHECEHKLQHCEKCDIIYCLKCSKEWVLKVDFDYSKLYIASDTKALFNDKYIK